MTKKFEKKMQELTAKYTRDMLCAVIAFEYDMGVDSYGMDPDEVMACVDMESLYNAVDEMSSDFEDMVNEYGERKMLAGLREYMEDEDGIFDDNTVSATTNQSNVVAGTPKVQAKAVSAQAVVAKNATTAPAPAPQKTTQTQPVPTHNYPNPVHDNFECAFQTWKELSDCVQDLEASEVVYTHDDDLQSSNPDLDPVQANLVVGAVDDTPMFAGSMAQTMGSSADAVLSTMRSQKGTGLTLKVGQRIVPIGFSAINGMNDCAGLKPNGFMRNWKVSGQEAAIRYNEQFHNGKGGVTVIERCEKIRAMCSARFAYGKFSDIMQMFENYWKAKWPKATVQGMYISHTVLRWQLNLSEYKAETFKGFPELLKSGYHMVLQFATSNTADSAFRIIPALQEKNGVVAPLCQQDEGVHVRHTARGNFGERVNALMNAVLASFDKCDGILKDAADRMEELKHITIHNPYNAVLRVMDECNVNKKQGMEAATNFQSFIGSNSASAFDCFLVVMNAYSFVCRDNPQNQDIRFTASLTVGKAANINWEQYDIPGDYKW